MAVAELDAEMVTPTQAARMLGRSKVRVLQLTDAGTLPCVRTPLGRLIDARAVRHLAEHPPAARPRARRRAELAKVGDPAQSTEPNLSAMVVGFLQMASSKAGAGVTTAEADTALRAGIVSGQAGG